MGVVGDTSTKLARRGDRRDEVTTMKAWVISIGSFDAVKSTDMIDEVVISLVSVRRTGSYVKSYIEDLVSIFRSNLDKQCKKSCYINARTDILAKVDGEGCVSYVDHPYVFIGQKADILSVDNTGPVSWITWKGINYLRFEVDPVTCKYKKSEDVNPPVKHAPQANFYLHNVFSRERYPKGSKMTRFIETLT